jgi:hypothetical protein
MTVTLNELLMLVGRLDDSAGFDSPRERFRRFLTQHVIDAHVARTLIEQCQHAPGDQHHRALQDIVVALGRCLGFDPKFDSHLPGAGSRRTDGCWRSRRLDVVLEIRIDQRQNPGLESLSGAVEAVAATSHPGKAGRVLGLCVLTPLYASRGRLEERQTADNPDPRVRRANLSSLLLLADMVRLKRMTHEDVVRLLGCSLELDFVAELLERASGASANVDSSTTSSTLFDVLAGTSFWLATIGTDQGATPEQFAEIVIGKRHIFGVGDAGAQEGSPQTGDSLCFHIPGKGVVGHAHVGSTAERVSGIRDAHRFTQLLPLERVALHMDAPVALDEEIQLRVRAAPASRDRAAHSVTRISRQEFDRLTTAHHIEERRVVESASSSVANDAGRVVLPVSVGDSRSHE